MDTGKKGITPAELIERLEKRNGVITQIERDTARGGSDVNGATIYDSYYTTAEGSRLHICHAEGLVRYYALTDRHGNTTSNI